MAVRSRRWHREMALPKLPVRFGAASETGIVLYAEQKPELWVERDPEGFIRTRTWDRKTEQVGDEWDWRAELAAHRLAGTGDPVFDFLIVLEEVGRKEGHIAWTDLAASVRRLEDLDNVRNWGIYPPLLALAAHAAPGRDTKATAYHWRAAAAANTSTPAFLLEQLSRDPDVRVVKEAARNPRLPKTAMGRLIESRSSGVREKLAQNRGLPVRLMSQLLHDHEVAVRMALVGNWRLPPELLLKLAQDGSPGVRCTVASRRSLPDQVKLVLAQDAEQSVRIAVMKRMVLPREATEALINDPTSYIREEMAKSYHVKVEHLQRLAQDRDADVRRAAEEHLAKWRPIAGRSL